MQHLATKVAKKYECEYCDYSTSHKQHFEKHFETNKHKINALATKSITEVLKKYECPECDYVTSQKYNWEKHLQTEKHLSNIATKSVKKVVKKCKCCMCGKDYTDRSGLWRHKKSCTGAGIDTSIDISSMDLELLNIPFYIPDENTVVKSEAEITQMTTLFLDSVKQNQEILMQNQEFQKKLFEMMKDNIGTINSHNTNTITTNNNNTKFNLNFFLNETCKDAMNLSEFVDNLQVTLADLENVGRLGYAEGISRIFTNGLKELDISRRPIHCSDLKREVVYVKNENKWMKETDQLRRAIKLITNKNIKLIPQWKAANPGHHQYHDKRNDEYLKIMYESMGPTDELEEKKSFGKIISNLAKYTTITK